MNGAPHHAVGRMMKVGKEEIIGMLVSVEAHMGRSIDEDYRRWSSYLQDISDAVTQVPGVRTTMNKPAGASPFCTQLTYRFDGRIQGQTIEGEVELGEYGKARWTARRAEPRQV
jgi:seryl-tRNA(Sec) selenium transferase